MSLAAKHATGRELPSGQFSGGSETNTFLQSLGFDIEIKGPVAYPPRKEAFPPRAQKPIEHGDVHNERCQKCKAAVLALLQKLFGSVEVQKRFEIGATPDAFGSSVYSSDLHKILVALQRKRGFSELRRGRTAPRPHDNEARHVGSEMATPRR